MNNTHCLNRLITTGLCTLLMLNGPVSQVFAQTINQGVNGSTSQLKNEIYINAGGAQLIRLNSSASNVFVANPDVADVQIKSPRLIYIYGRQAGETQIFAVSKGDKVLLDKRIVVGANVKHLNQTMKKMFPASNVSARMVNQSLMLTGDVSRAVDADQIRRLALQYVSDEKMLFNRTRLTSPNQVNLRVRVAEVSREVTKQLGFNWNLNAIISGFTFGLVTANPVAALIGNSLTVAETGGNLNFSSVIDALEENGMISILAEPNLTAISGEEANFLAGGEFPILVPTGNGDVTVEFKEYGVSLKFTPTIMDRNRINLRVAPEVSQLSTTGAVQINGFSIPSLTTRRADTVVEMASGQSIAIAGFLQRGSQHDINKFPGLGDLPILGGLFRSDKFQRNETELVIMVTPYIVKPVVPQRMASPTDNLQLPKDYERIAYGATYQDTTPTAESETLPQGQQLHGGLQLDMNYAATGTHQPAPQNPNTTHTAYALRPDIAESIGKTPPKLIGPVGFEYE